MLILFLILTPFLAVLFSLLTRKQGWLELLACLSAILEFGLGFDITLQVIQDGAYQLSSFFLVDALGAVILLTITIIGLLATFYSIGYIRAEMAKQIFGPHRFRQFYILLRLFLLAMLFAVTTANPIMMWIAIEATTLSTAFLISFYNKPAGMEAAWKYLIINSIGLLLGFFGTLLFFTSQSLINHGFINWQELLTNAGALNPLVAKMAFVFVLIGYGTKVGLAPMHTWLPDAHSKAPVPISSLLSGVLLSVAMLAVLRFKIITDHAVGPMFAGNLLIFFGALSLVISSFIIYGQKNYKRLLAYSSIEHMGIVALGFGFGGLGTFAALLHIIYHALAKSLLFFSAGIIFIKYSSTKIEKVSGVLRALPLTGIIFFAGFLTITGVPPFGIFITEFYILTAGIGRWPLTVLLALFSLALVFAGFLRHISKMVFGEIPEKINPEHPANPWLRWPLLILAGMIIFLSFHLPFPLLKLLNAAVDIIQ